MHVAASQRWTFKLQFFDCLWTRQRARNYTLICSCEMVQGLVQWLSPCYPDFLHGLVSARLAVCEVRLFV